MKRFRGIVDFFSVDLYNYKNVFLGKAGPRLSLGTKRVWLDSTLSANYYYYINWLYYYIILLNY